MCIQLYTIVLLLVVQLFLCSFRVQLVDAQAFGMMESKAVSLQNAAVPVPDTTVYQATKSLAVVMASCKVSEQQNAIKWLEKGLPGDGCRTSSGVAVQVYLYEKCIPTFVDIPPKWGPCTTVKHLKNLGCETYAYLDYLLNEYNNLADFVLCSQAGDADTEGSVSGNDAQLGAQLLKVFIDGWRGGFLPGNSIEEMLEPCSVDYYWLETCALRFATQPGSPQVSDTHTKSKRPAWHQNCGGEYLTGMRGSFIVRHDFVTRLPRSTWESLLTYVISDAGGQGSPRAHTMERAWSSIFCGTMRTVAEFIECGRGTKVPAAPSNDSNQISILIANNQPDIARKIEQLQGISTLEMEKERMVKLVVGRKKQAAAYRKSRTESDGVRSRYLIPRKETGDGSATFNYYKLLDKELR
jgi:hypothetical protein